MLGHAALLARSLAGAALQTMSKECPVRKEADRYCKAAMAAIKSVDDQLTGHIAYLYQVSGGSSQQQGRKKGAAAADRHSRI